MAKVSCPDCGNPCEVHLEAHANSINCPTCGLLCELEYIDFIKDLNEAEGGDEN